VLAAQPHAEGQLAKLRPEPIREPLPPLDALPRATTTKRWQAGCYIEPFSR
jgi:hypothetical protein